MKIPRDHPSFAGHFPGHPVLPAVVILTGVLAAVETATGRAREDWTVANAKFLAPVAPGESLSLTHESTATGSVRFEVRSPAGVVASGTLARREP